MAETGRRKGRRPIVIIPSRFSDHASALRYCAEVSARALIEAVYHAGGEPLVMHPCAPHGQADVDEVRDRLSVADAILLPGGADLDPSWSGQSAHPSRYDVDVEQDGFDLAVARIALEDELPLLAICRGMQVVNVMLGGDTVQDMTVKDIDALDGRHRHRVHSVKVHAGSRLDASSGTRLTASCRHHQCVDRVGEGLEVVARAQDGVIEALELPDRLTWFLGVQWHPEDTAASDPAQAAVFAALVTAAATHCASPSPRPC